MGGSYEVSCKECDYTKRFMIGIGMMYSPQNIVDLDSEFALLTDLIRSKKTLAHIRELLNEKKAVLADGYGHKVYRCPKCGEFYERFCIRLNYEDGSFEVEYKCPKCKTALKPFKGDIVLEKYPCPKCGRHSLYESKTVDILWD